MIVRIPLRWDTYLAPDGKVFFTKTIGGKPRLVPFFLTKDVGGSLLQNLILLFKHVQSKDTSVGDVYFPLEAKPVWEAQHPMRFAGGRLLGARVHYTLEPCNQVRVVGRNGDSVSVPWE